MEKALFLSYAIVCSHLAFCCLATGIDKQQELKKIEYQLEMIRNDIDKKYFQEIHRLIGPSSGASIEEIEQYVKEGRRCIKEDLRRERSFPLRHNVPESPKDFVSFFEKTISDHDISSNRIDLNCLTIDKGDALIESNLVAVAVGRLTFSADEQGIERINIYKPFFQHSRDEQAFILGHEVGHLLLGHKPVELNFNFSPGDNRFKMLRSITEQQADIYSALHSDELACVASCYRCKRPHADILDSKAHCNTLQTICSLIKQKKEFR